MNIEIIEFLIPHLDPIQIIFFLVIFGATIFTIVMVRRRAKPENWESNWDNDSKNGASDELDAEHGSVHDICQAVATKPEQLADVLPGILLVIGLLGTFLGLGMALNKASAILMDASANGMDDAMSNLMSMMQGLGTKFKTSTWGIMAFLGLKGWASYNGFDERRLRWTAQKMKRNLDESRSQQLKREQVAQLEFVTSISTLGDKLCTTLLQQFTQQREVLTKEAADTRQMFQQELTLDRELQQRSQDILTGHQAIARQTADQGAALLLQLGEFATASASSMRTLEESLCHTLQQEFSGQREILQRNQELLDEQKSLASGLLKQSTSTRQALESFVTANSGNIESMRQSSEKMAVSADKVGASATELGTAITSFETNVSEVMNVLKRDLKSTIDNMNASFKSNMGEISTNLLGATNNISQAVSALSTNVEQTMAEVKHSISKSLDIQQKTQAVFGETSLTLNTSVEGLTQLINQLCDDIKSGLKAVSESGRRMTSLDSRYQDVTQSAENSVQKISELLGQVSNAVNRLQSPTVNVDLKPLLKSIEQISKHLESQEDKLGHQISSALQAKLPAAQFDQAIAVLRDIQKSLNRPERSAAPAREQQ